MSSTFTIQNQSYDLIQCCSCGVNFLIPAIMNKNAWEKRDEKEKFREGFFCPNGHSLAYYSHPQQKKKEPPIKKEGNIIDFFRTKKDDESHKLDPKPAC